MRDVRPFTRIAAVLYLVAACGPDGGPPGGAPDDGEPAGTLVIQPGDLMLAVQDGVAQSQSYTAIYFDAAGKSYDVTGDTEFSVSNSVLGGFDGALLTTASDRAGRAVVSGRYGVARGEANLVITLSHTVIEEGAPADAADRFASARPGGAEPELVYPNSGILVPPNLNSFEFHFAPGDENEVFELSFTGELVGLKVYFVCSAIADRGCGYEPSESTWELLATAGRGEQPIYYTLRGLDPTTGRAGASSTSGIQFAIATTRVRRWTHPMPRYGSSRPAAAPRCGCPTLPPRARAIHGPRWRRSITLMPTGRCTG